MEIIVSDALRAQFPAIKLGIIQIRNVENKKSDTEFEKEKIKLEDYIHQNYTDVKNFEIIKKYNQFFKKFSSNYPILFQVQSILKGKSFPSASCAVEAMFMAELKSMYLTAGHDIDTINGDLTVTITEGGEEYTKINNKEQVLKANDIICYDNKGIISSVLYGPDSRTKITLSSSSCLFFSYFPYGEEDANIMKHFNTIVENIKIFSKNVLDVSEIWISE